MCRVGAHKVIWFCWFNLQVPFVPEELKLLCIKTGLGEVSMRFHIVFPSRYKLFPELILAMASGVLLHMFVWCKLTEFGTWGKKSGSWKAHLHLSFLLVDLWKDLALLSAILASNTKQMPELNYRKHFRRGAGKGCLSSLKSPVVTFVMAVIPNCGVRWTCMAVVLHK